MSTRFTRRRRGARIPRFALTGLALGIGLATGTAHAGFGFGFDGGLVTFDADLTVPGLNAGTAFPVVVNPDNSFLPDVVRDGFQYGAVESPDGFDFYNNPVFAVVQCGSEPGGSILEPDDPSVYGPWDKSVDPYGVGFNDPLFCLTQVGEIDDLYLFGGDTGAFSPFVQDPYSANGDFIDEINGASYDLENPNDYGGAGNFPVSPPSGAPDFAFYGIDGMNFEVWDYGGEVLAGSLVANDGDWAGGWPGIVLDKIFFDDISFEIDLEMNKRQDSSTVAVGVDQGYDLEVYGYLEGGVEPEFAAAGLLAAGVGSCTDVELPGFRIIDDLPPGALPPTLATCSLDDGPPLAGTVDGNQIVWDFGDVTADLCGFSTVATCRVEVAFGASAAGQDVCNQGQVLTDAEEVTKQNNLDEVCTSVAGAPFADAFVNKSAPFSVRRNQYFSYNISYGNVTGGGDNAQNVQIVDQLPASSTDFAFSSASPGGIYNAATRTVTWNIGDVGPGGGGSVWVQGRTLAGLGAVITNCATVSASNDDNAANDESCRDTRVRTSRDPNDKLACPEGTDLLDPGSVDACIDDADNNVDSIVKTGRRIFLDDPQSRTLEFVVRAENIGDAPAEDVFIEDTLDLNVDDDRFGSDKSLFIYDGGFYNSFTRTIRWNVGELAECPNPPAPGEEGGACTPPRGDGANQTMVRYQVRVADDLECGDSVSNQAFITFPDAVDPVTPTNVTTHFTRPRADATGDCAIDINDVRQIVGFRGRPAEDCPECDQDGDGHITVGDARQVALQCDLPRCAVK